jgi:hypothetical protein
LEGNKLRWALDRNEKGKTGPFCSRVCAGKYGKQVQLGGPKLPLKKTKKLYTTRKLMGE